MCLHDVDGRRLETPAAAAAPSTTTTTTTTRQRMHRSSTRSRHVHASMQHEQKHRPVGTVGTVAILAQGTNWAVAVSQAFLQVTLLKPQVCHFDFVRLGRGCSAILGFHTDAGRVSNTACNDKRQRRISVLERASRACAVNLADAKYIADVAGG